MGQLLNLENSQIPVREKNELQAGSLIHNLSGEKVKINLQTLKDTNGDIAEIQKRVNTHNGKSQLTYKKDNNPISKK